MSRGSGSSIEGLVVPSIQMKYRRTAICCQNAAQQSRQCSLTVIVARCCIALMARQYCVPSSKSSDSSSSRAVAVAVLSSVPLSVAVAGLSRCCQFEQTLQHIRGCVTPSPAVTLDDQPESVVHHAQDAQDDPAA